MSYFPFKIASLPTDAVINIIILSARLFLSKIFNEPDVVETSIYLLCNINHPHIYIFIY